MQKLSLWFKVVLCGCFIFLSVSYADDKSVAIFIRDDVYNDYIRFLNSREVLEVTDFSGEYIRRDIVDMILAQQALKLGGFDKSFRYQRGNINFTNSKMLEKGILLISFDTYWLTDANIQKNSVYISDAVIRRGEYFAGIFASPNNKKVRRLRSLSDFNDLSSVSTPRWHTDWSTLKQLPLKKLVREDEWLSQVRMVSMQWVDFMLMPLMPEVNNHYVLEDISLIAVPDTLVLLDDSRHFVISKRHPEGQNAFAAMQKGLAMLRKQGRIKKAYTEAGFFPDTSDKLIINLPLIHRKQAQKSSQG